ncbi:MAG TPA: hypothetical protein DEA43_01310 [Candidatus Moranbacteria bacterium]|nr:hypothetical protein [Candidatus Moranbacteria bacterium]HBT45506.1 hypothetical protein [Candidatus Moranbacteria bacterium]
MDFFKFPKILREKSELDTSGQKAFLKSAEPMRPLFVKNLDEAIEDQITEKDVPVDLKAEASLLGAKDLGAAAASAMTKRQERIRKDMVEKYFEEIFHTQKKEFQDLKDEDKKVINDEKSDFLEEIKSSFNAVTNEDVENGLRDRFLNQLHEMKISKEARDYVRKVCGGIEVDEFLGRKENKGLEEIFKEAKGLILKTNETKKQFRANNPGIKLVRDFTFDLVEKIDYFIQKIDEDIDFFTVEEEALCKKVLGASKGIIKGNGKKTSIVMDGFTYNADSANVVINEVKPAAVETDAEKEERMKFSRAGAQITLQRVDKWEDLDVVDPAEKGEHKGDKNFIEKTKKLWKEFAVHGLYKDGKLQKFTDLDGKGCLELLKLAKINIKDLKYIDPGTFEEGRINLDTGGKDGVVAEDFDKENKKTAFIDHHGEESLADSSATAKTYRMLVDLGLLEKNPKLDEMVKFVNQVDNAQYPKIETYFENSHKTIIGLQNYIHGSKLVNFFMKDNNPDPTRELSEGELKKYGFIYPGVGDKKGTIVNRSENQRNVKEKSKESLERMEKEGFIITSDRYGKIAVSIENGIEKKNIPGDILAVKAFGCDSLVIWNPRENKFKISTNNEITEEYSQGVKVRGIMWVKNNSDSSELTVTLGEILNKMTDGKLVAEGKLKEYLEQEVALPVSNADALSVEAPKEKTPEDLFKDLIVELSVFNVERYQLLYNEMMDVAGKKGVVGDEKKKLVLSVLPNVVERDIARHTKKRGEELEKISEYILSQIK